MKRYVREGQCPAVEYGWCQAPWGCAQPCTGRGGDSHAKKGPDNDQPLARS